jgi:hypothetical protein
MLRIAVLGLFLIACSKKQNDKPAPAPPPQVADATVGADAADTAAGSGAAGSDTGSGSSAGSAGSAAAGSDTGSGSAVAGDFDFDKLSKEDKVKFMKTKVMPTMKPLFQKFDAKDFAGFNCKTCHGKDPQKTKYKMPSPDLPALDFDAIKAGKEDPKVIEFMSKTVKPTMAKLFNMPEMTESEPKGFGCLACHTLKKKKK